jgi:tyrosyl-tRNA synthetase
MATIDSGLLADLQARGLIAQMTAQDELQEHLNSASRTLYCGFDPTADSLHIGHLVPLLMLRRFQQAGHRPIALVGGATGLIGDPSFKAQERQLNTADVVAGWVGRLKAQVSRFIDLDNAIVANNLDWIGGMDVLTFLRDIGKYFSVNAMIAKESVKQRIERPDSGISFTEFSYMILQSLDFAELYKRHDCTLQLGGSDQWGNITGGIDLTRRLHQGQVFGITVPLITKSDGTKFGKTESGTVWLDAAKTSPYAFYQFWLSTADADVYRFLRYFTFLSVAEIAAIEEADRAAEGRPQAQSVLAREMTRLIHGDEGLAAAQRITDALFSGDIQSLSENDFVQLGQDGLPMTAVARGELVDRPLTQLLTDIGMVSSGKQVKDALARNAVYVNGAVISAEQNMQLPSVFSAENAKFHRFYLVKLGKKTYHLIRID